MSEISLENIVQVSVRLGNLPWRWVAVEDIFPGGEKHRQIEKWSCLAKDAPEHLTCAIRLDRVRYPGHYRQSVLGPCPTCRGGYEAMRAPHWHVFDFFDMPDSFHPRSLSYFHGSDIEHFFLPLGFAQEVLQWREDFTSTRMIEWVDDDDNPRSTLLAPSCPEPKGIWEEFRDEVRSPEEGGSPEAWVSHYVGPMWWVVYPPQQGGKK